MWIEKEMEVLQVERRGTLVGWSRSKRHPNVTQIEGEVCSGRFTTGGPPPRFTGASPRVMKGPDRPVVKGRWSQVLHRGFLGSQGTHHSHARRGGTFVEWCKN